MHSGTYNWRQSERSVISVEYSRAQVFEKISKSSLGYILLGIESKNPLTESNSRRYPVDSVIIFEHSNANSSQYNNSNALEVTKRNILSLTTGHGYRHSSDRLAICSDSHNMLPLQPYSNIRPSLLMQKLATLSVNEFKSIQASSFSSALALLVEAPQTYYKCVSSSGSVGSWERQRDRGRLIVIVSEDSQATGLDLPKEVINALTNRSIILIILVLDNFSGKHVTSKTVASLPLIFSKNIFLPQEAKDSIRAIRLTSLMDGVLSSDLVEALCVPVVTKLAVHFEVPGWRVTEAVPFCVESDEYAKDATVDDVSSPTEDIVDMHTSAAAAASCNIQADTPTEAMSNSRIVRSRTRSANSFCAAYDESVVRDGQQQLVLLIDDFYRMSTDECGRLHRHREEVFFVLTSIQVSEVNGTAAACVLQDAGLLDTAAARDANPLPVLRGAIHVAYTDSDSHSRHESIRMGEIDPSSSLGGCVVVGRPNANAEWVIVRDAASSDDTKDPSPSPSPSIGSAAASSDKGRARPQSRLAQVCVDTELNDDDDDDDGFELVSPEEEEDDAAARELLGNAIAPTVTSPPSASWYSRSKWTRGSRGRELSKNVERKTTGDELGEDEFSMDALFSVDAEAEGAEEAVGSAVGPQDVFESAGVRRALMLVNISQCLSRLPLDNGMDIMELMSLYQRSTCCSQCPSNSMSREESPLETSSPTSTAMEVGLGSACCCISPIACGELWAVDEVSRSLWPPSACFCRRARTSAPSGTCVRLPLRLRKTKSVCRLLMRNIEDVKVRNVQKGMHRRKGSVLACPAERYSAHTPRQSSFVPSSPLSSSLSNASHREETLQSLNKCAARGDLQPAIRELSDCLDRLQRHFDDCPELRSDILLQASKERVSSLLGTLVDAVNRAAPIAHLNHGLYDCVLLCEKSQFSSQIEA